MAHAVTEEKRNFSKLTWIINDICSEIQRDFLSLHIPAVNIPSIYPGKMKLNSRQLAIYRNIPTDTDYRNCDNNMLYTLLRNVVNLEPPVNGWGKPVDENSLNVADDLERLRCYRNNLYAHSTSASVDNQEYNQFLEDIESIFKRFDSCHAGAYAPLAGSGSYVAKLQRLKTESMDKDKTDQYEKQFKMMVAGLDDLEIHLNYTDKKVDSLEKEQTQRAEDVGQMKIRITDLEQEHAEDLETLTSKITDLEQGRSHRAENVGELTTRITDMEQGWSQRAENVGELTSRITDLEQGRSQHAENVGELASRITDLEQGRLPRPEEPLDRRILDSVANHITGDWKRLGRALQITEAKIEQIDMDNCKTYEKALQCLNAWQQIAGRNVCWNLLKDALAQLPRHEIISMIEKNFFAEGYTRLTEDVKDDKEGIKGDINDNTEGIKGNTKDIKGNTKDIKVNTEFIKDIKEDNEETKKEHAEDLGKLASRITDLEQADADRTHILNFPGQSQHNTLIAHDSADAAKFSRIEIKDSTVLNLNQCTGITINTREIMQESRGKMIAGSSYAG